MRFMLRSEWGLEGVAKWLNYDCLFVGFGRAVAQLGRASELAWVCLG